MSNDYTQTAEDLEQAIHVVETAYYNAKDEEDQAAIDDALDILRTVRDRAKTKGGDDD